MYHRTFFSFQTLKTFLKVQKRKDFSKTHTNALGMFWELNEGSLGFETHQN